LPDIHVRNIILRVPQADNGSFPVDGQVVEQDANGNPAKIQIT
jgi:hypothetical protein